MIFTKQASSIMRWPELQSHYWTILY